MGLGFSDGVFGGGGGVFVLCRLSILLICFVVVGVGVDGFDGRLWVNLVDVVRLVKWLREG